METLEPIQISESTIVFTRDALDAAVAAGTVEPEYMSQIRRQMAAEAVSDVLEGARDAVGGYFSAIASNLKLEARMVVFDAIHGTHYRQIRHDLVEKRRREQFEKSIGLTAIK